MRKKRAFVRRVFAPPGRRAPARFYIQLACRISVFHAKTPSAFSLAAVFGIYRTDRFKNPNNAVTYGERYPPGGGGAPAPEPA